MRDREKQFPEGIIVVDDIDDGEELTTEQREKVEKWMLKNHPIFRDLAADPFKLKLIE